MRIQQLTYLEKIVEKGSINEASKELFLSQPSLSNAIKELEQEMGIQILLRHKSGVSLTAEGREFMIYARQILDQVNLLEGKYKANTPRKQAFSVSAQHYAFVVHAFVELIKEVAGEEYQFTLRETETLNILADLKDFKSELGILYLNRFNRQVMEKLFKDSDLEFHPLFTALPHVFVSRNNPLTKQKAVTLADLEDYPYLSYEQGEGNSFYFSEEILSTLHRKKHIKVSDRATIFNLMVGLEGYTISSGIISSELNDDKIVAIPLEVEDPIQLGWVKHRQITLSTLGERYLDLLKEHIQGYGFVVE
ncbi:LysR family transcriptional regulator [Enterococcus asini]|uniref:LysR family transcriptional regulator n=1 Tax=Enterococcus asini TaxID=57732 RepID=UPI00288E9147|nr:LysR family transcriptional regulator [Enterococcus asini]MDT2756371.1 LysR family transcriptional regulator [Enterococcus asini]